MTKDDIEKAFKRKQAKQRQIENEQGLGKPIISEKVGENRFVAVGSRLFVSNKWKTFHDFLFEYIKSIFPKDWGNDELKKPLQERHPILQWYEASTTYLNSKLLKRGEINKTYATGAIVLYIDLAYNLYLISHNKHLQNSLINRLIKKDQFQGAYFETFVAGTFIKAGFDIDFENEDDPKDTHCEFTATHKVTKEKYSVEAKSREPNKRNLNIGNQLYKALKKKADNTRIVFIDLNARVDSSERNKKETLIEAIKSCRKKEATLNINGKPAPKAYIIIVNHTYRYGLDDIDCTSLGVGEGFKIPDFKFDTKFRTLREMINSREKHSEIYDLLDSMTKHRMAPISFDGEFPEFDEVESKNRLLIGEKYILPENGRSIVAELIGAEVIKKDKAAICIFKTEEGKTVIYTCPLSDKEFEAFLDHSETFFGVAKSPSEAKDPVDLYYWLMNSYKNIEKEKLIEYMRRAGISPIETSLSRNKLLEIYCERMAENILSQP